jgi:hypothetical protein
MQKGEYDPRWTEISASLRRRSLFLKMPLRTASTIIRILENILEKPENPTQESLKSGLLAMLQEEVSGAIEYCLWSIFCRIPAREAAQLADSLLEIELLDSTKLLSGLRQTLNLGLLNDPKVDWISRVGGPPPDGSLHGLIPNPDPIDIDLSELSLDD